MTCSATIIPRTIRRLRTSRHGTNVLVRTWYKTMADHTYTVAGLTVTKLRSEHSSSRTLRGGSPSGEVMPETQASTVGIVVGLVVEASIAVERISEVVKRNGMNLGKLGVKSQPEQLSQMSHSAKLFKQRIITILLNVFVGCHETVLLLGECTLSSP